MSILAGVISSSMRSSSGGIFTIATGGTVTTIGDYKIHTFTASANFVPTQTGSLPFEVLVVADACFVLLSFFSAEALLFSAEAFFFFFAESFAEAFLFLLRPLFAEAYFVLAEAFFFFCFFG